MQLAQETGKNRKSIKTLGLIEGLTGTDIRLLIEGGAASLVVPGTNGRTVLEDARYLDPQYRHVGQASLRQYQLIHQRSAIRPLPMPAPYSCELPATQQLPLQYSYGGSSRVGSSGSSRPSAIP